MFISLSYAVYAILMLRYHWWPLSPSIFAVKRYDDMLSLSHAIMPPCFTFAELPCHDVMMMPMMIYVARLRHTPAEMLSVIDADDPLIITPRCWHTTLMLVMKSYDERLLMRWATHYAMFDMPLLWLLMSDIVDADMFTLSPLRLLLLLRVTLPMILLLLLIIIITIIIIYYDYYADAGVDYCRWYYRQRYYVDAALRREPLLCCCSFSMPQDKRLFIFRYAIRWCLLPISLLCHFQDAYSFFIIYYFDYFTLRLRWYC